MLQGKVAVVTGSTRGIGRGIAEALCIEGAAVVLNGRSVEKGAQAVAEMGERGRVVFQPGDVSVRTDAEAVVDRAVREFGRLDILVNNAGGNPGTGMVAELSDEAWFGSLDLNLTSAFFATRHALPHLVASGAGRIVNISSVEGKQATKAAIANYITTKHALNGFTKAVAFEYGPLGVTCNAICPGAVETDVMRGPGREYAVSVGQTYAQFLDGYAQGSMIKRLNTVEEVAAMAVLLASPAGGGITGSLLNVDGGSAPY